MTFGQAVRALRMQAKLSQEELAEAVGSKQGFISMIELGTRGVKQDPDIVAKLETALKLKPGTLAQYLPPDHPARRMSATASGATLKHIGAVAAGGFSRLLPAGADEYLDVRERFPAGCVLATVSGPSCARFGLFDGDLVAVRETGEPEDGRFVLAETAEGLTLKLYWQGHLYQWFPNQDGPEMVPFSEDTAIRGVVVQRVGDVKLDDPATLLATIKPAKKKGRK